MSTSAPAFASKTSTSSAAAVDPPTTRRIAAVSLVGGGLSMLLGAGLFVASGADLDTALEGGKIVDYLHASQGVTSLLVANLSLWILGVLLLGIGGSLASTFSAGPVAAAARQVYAAGTPTAIVAFVAWLALVTQIAPAADAVPAEVATALGWFASRTDWIATVLLVGLGPALLSRSSGEWMPRWLRIWGGLAALAGALTILAMFTGGLTTFGFAVVPVGIGWSLAAGILLFR